jgi:translation initiation factor IF-2
LSRDKVRLYQLARELDVDSKELIDLLKAAGADVKNHMTTIDAETRQLAEDLVSGRTTVRTAAAVRAVAASQASPPVQTGAIPPPRSERVRQIPKTAQTADEERAATVAAEPVSATVAGPGPATGLPMPAAPTVATTAPSPAPPDVAAFSPPPTARLPGEIPSPVTPRPSVIPAPKPSEPTELKPQRPLRELRPSRPRPIVAPPVASPPKPVTAQPSSKHESAAGVQKPVMKLSPEALREGKFAVPDAAARRAAKPELAATDLDEDEIAKAKQKSRGGALAGREERQRRRGQRAAAKRFLDDLDLSADDENGEGPRRTGRVRSRRGTLVQTVKTRGSVTLEMPVTVRTFSEAAGIRVNELMRKLIGLGIMTNINETLTDEQCALLGIELGLDVSVKKPKDAEAWLDDFLSAKTQDSESLQPRPPIVTFMGHVDHGKTSLMDRIRSANVVATESGGITQHIGAYQLRQANGAVITFLDTPGHEAFTALRARGANVTDIVILVVAADDGVMPQTQEAISHAKAADVPIIVAMNKIDLPNANPDRLMQQLSTLGLIPEKWGGDTFMVETSALTGKGITELLQAIGVVAELRDIQANPNRTAIGTCLEASLSEGRGAQPTMLVQHGTLRRGDLVVCGTAIGRVRAMFDDTNRTIDEAGPSTPVVVIGLDEVPAPGERFLVLEDTSRGRELVALRRARARDASRVARQHVTLDKFFDALQERRVKELLLIVKADVRGSLDAIRKEVGGLEHAEVRVRIIHEGVGGITESDVLLADASDAIVIGFRVVPEDRAAVLASENGVEIRRYEIIYQVSDDIKKALEGLLAPEARELQQGRAVVQETFTISRVGTIAGCRVVQGVVERGTKARVVRDGTIIGAYAIESLRRIKDDVREVREGLECGIKLAGFNDVKRGDLLETFRVEEIKRTL